MLKAYADEHVVFALVEALRRRGMDVVRVQDRGRQQADDTDLLDEALADEWVILTNDTDFLQLAAERAAHQQEFARIFFWPQQQRTLAEQIAVGREWVQYCTKTDWPNIQQTVTTAGEESYERYAALYEADDKSALCVQKGVMRSKRGQVPLPERPATNLRSVPCFAQRYLPPF